MTKPTRVPDAIEDGFVILDDEAYTPHEWEAYQRRLAQWRAYAAAHRRERVENTQRWRARRKAA